MTEPRSDRRHRLYLLAICAVVAIMSLLLAYLGPQADDEGYHYPLAKSFPQDFSVFSESYSSAYTPLPYVLVGSWMRVAGSSLFSARAFNLIIGIVGLFGFFQLARCLSPQRPMLPVVFLAFQPYYLRNCMVFYMGNYGLVAVIWALRFYLSEKSTRNTLLTGVLLGAATMCAQWSLTVVGGVVLAEGVRLFEAGWNTTAVRVRRFLSTALILVAFQIPALLVFAGWGGLTTPNFQAHALGVSPQHITGTLAVLGFVFGFWLLGRLRSLSPIVAVMLVVLTPLLLLSLPEVSVYQGVTRFSGLAARILAGISTRMGFSSPAMIFPAASLGLVLLYLLFRPRTGPLLAVRLGALLLIVAYSVTGVLGETHVAFSVPLIFLLVWAEHGRDIWVRLVVAQSSLLGIAYAYYVALIKFS